MKVLVSAYACEPGKGSEPEVGWQWVRQIARFHKTWVITRTNNRDNIEKYLKEYQTDNLRFIYVDIPKWAAFWKKGRRGVHLYYYLWQILALKTALKLRKEIDFDIAHHITFVNMYMTPGLGFGNIPFIWGPVGANPYIPSAFIPFLGISGQKDNVFRYGVRILAKTDMLLADVVSRAKRIIAINNEVKQRFPKVIQKKISNISQNAITPDFIRPTFRKKQNDYLRVLSVGQLVSIKGFPLVLHAFAKHLAYHPLSRLTIVGDGQQRAELESLTKKLNISHAVNFAGQIPRSRVLEIMAESDVFLFPSFEGAGMVVIEAMAKGLPVVCSDFGGPGEYVTHECGIKVPLTSPDEFIEGLAEGLNKLASDSVLYERLSAGALERVRSHYVWDNIGERLNAIYEEVLRER